MYYEHGLIKRPDNYDELRWTHWNINNNLTDKLKHKVADVEYSGMLEKFYKRYPDVKYTIAHDTPGTYGKGPKNPAVSFIMKQRKLMDEGFTENKAFEMVEEEMADQFEKHREENRILRGFALNNRARSYLNYSQQLSEIEGRAKVQQMQRDLAKYIYQEQRWDDSAINYVSSYFVNSLGEHFSKPEEPD
jgi:hypothetical protein